jgi:hypothetical protein
LIYNWENLKYDNLLWFDGLSSYNPTRQPLVALQGLPIMASSNKRFSSILNNIGGTTGVYLPYYVSDHSLPSAYVFYNQPVQLQTIVVQNDSQQSQKKFTPLSSVVIHHFPPASIAITIS